MTYQKLFWTAKSKFEEIWEGFTKNHGFTRRFEEYRGGFWGSFEETPAIFHIRYEEFWGAVATRPAKKDQKYQVKNEKLHTSSSTRNRIKKWVI